MTGRWVCYEVGSITGQATKSDIEALRQGTRADIASLKADLLKWMFGALIAQGGLIVALVKLL